MNIQESITLESLNSNEVTIVKSYYIEMNNQKIQVGEIEKNSFMNTEEDKNILKDILSEPYYNGIIAFWKQFNNQKNEITNYE